MLIRLFLTVIFGMVCFVCWTQQAVEKEADSIVTDRPDFTESALVVRKGRLQLESGFTYQKVDGSYVLNLPEALLRYGVGRNFEWRLGVPNYFHARSGGQDSTGVGATYLGVKYQFDPTRDGIDISVIPAVFLPTGGRAFQSGGWDPEVKLCLSKSLSDRLTISGMLYGAWVTEEDRRNFSLQQTVSLGYGLGGRWGAFLETANTFPERGASQHLLHSGVTYLLNANTQLDFHFGFGLSRDAPSHFIAAGYSIRF